MKLGVPATLLSNRPDVMAAEYNLINAFELTNVAKSSFYPSLTLTASGGLQSLELDKLFNANSLFANIVGGLTQPIFNKRKLKNTKRSCYCTTRTALLNFKKTLLVAGNEVSNALYSYNLKLKNSNLEKMKLKLYVKQKQILKNYLKMVMLTYLDLLTARQSALSAELKVIDSKLQQLQSVVNLYEALGGGLK